MNLEEEFDKRIAAIHGLDNTKTTGHKIEGDTMDVRHAEFQAMADVFLGKDFDLTKLKQFEDMQMALHNEQANLYRGYEAEEIGPEEYVELFNKLLDETFIKCEDILGMEDFIKVFGVPRSKVAGFIDKETFLKAHKSRRQQH